MGGGVKREVHLVHVRNFDISAGADVDDDSDVCLQGRGGGDRQVQTVPASSTPTLALYTWHPFVVARLLSSLLQTHFRT